MEILEKKLKAGKIKGSSRGEKECKNPRKNN